MKNIFRKIFYILLAVCLLGGGTYALTLSPQSETTFAENTAPQEISNNNLPEYFGVNETDGGGLISSNIFAYSSGASLSLSLKTNGTFNAGTSSVYEYVYYPDKEIHPDNPNIFHFYFYQVSALSLTINGETRNLDQQQFVTKSSEHFTNYFAADLHAFEIKFNETGTQSNAINETGTQSNAIKLLDDQNNLIEGIYTLNLQIVLFECTDGTTDASETQFENERLVDISYSFYVVNKSDYLTNNMPNVTRNAFDTEIEATTSSVFDYYLYSNYSSEDTTNSIPYIEYDYERYEISINKTISVSTYTQSLLYDIDTQSVVTTGDNIVTITQNTQNHTARVYFYNVGNYVVTYNDILLQEIDGELEKHKLTGFSNQTKKYQIYVYGYQANYTDMDATPDSNNIRPVAELKTLDFEEGTFSQSADITSAFLNSNVAYSQATYNTSILISNVAEYINNNGITPIKTNQTPIKFTENARLSTDSSITSYIYTTNNLAGYTETEDTLGGQTLYRKRFTGQAEGATGTYIYIITYTFDDFRTSSATTAPNKYFRQVFFFEINKELPTITIETESGKNIRNFVNENVLIYDTTKTQTPYNKDVQIRIFARDFNNNFISDFGGAQGKNYNDLLENENDEHITLSQSAFYTIRLYFENEIKGTTISFYNDTKKIREVPFTIDKMEIKKIRGTNVSEILDSTDYSVVSAIEGLTTNQNFVLSWDRKASGASTTAYYRYFKIDAFQYHTSSSNFHFQSAVLEHMLGLENPILPINNTLDMDTTENSWNIYAGNADSQIEHGRVSAEYVFTDGGLYLVDVFDEAGNHAYNIFLLDYTSPIFAIYNTSTGKYSIPNSAEFVADDSVLFWSKYKGLIFTNFEDFYTGHTKEGQYSVSDNLLQGKNLYKNHDGEYVREIYNTFFDKIKTAGFLTYINCEITPQNDTALYGGSYTGAYLTIPISSTYWRLNENNRYEKKVNQYQESIDSSKELNYRIIIRDESNTKLVPNIADNTAVQHYTQHPSASQRIAVSFDTSNFAIFYTENGEREYLFSNNTAEQEIEGKTYKTTYLNPKSKETAFYLAFTPTQEKEGENITIQVSDVTINYYAYITESETIDGVVYNYMTLSENPVAIPVYEFDENSSVQETEEKDVPIKINIDGYTAAGKYVITRRYQTGDGFTYNGKDFYSRTFVFYVDRNDVITNPDLVTNSSTSHLESLVGGDIFIAMYDNGETSDLVVTFPDSYNGNSKSSSLYNSGIPRTVLTTNKLPVSIYIPQYKYTKSVQKVSDANGYHFEVTPNEEMNTYYSSSVITEYLLYATLEKANFSESGVETSRSLIARTSNSATPTSSSIFTDGHGFLRFYSASNNTPFYSLEESGRYYVTIYQGYLIGEDVQSLTFTFDIQKSDPDFEATSTSGTELGKIGNNYYTNQSTISLVWDASTSEYIADIDPDAIVFETNNSIKYTKSSDIWDEIWVQTPTLSNNSYISQISLEKLGVYSNGASVKVTMQYKNHSRYYQKVTKTIHVDLSAPSTTINNLISKSVEGSNISGLNASSLRTFYTADMQETTGQDVSYNISNNSGTFAFYSYSVNESFINTLKTSPDYYRTYVKKFEGTKYQTGELQETSPADFLPSNYTEVSKASLTLAAGNYYEVVETDLAQNLTIYTIYVTNYSDNTEALISYKNAANEEFSYTVGDYKEVLSHSGANHNIYARTGFRLQDINYFGDEWAQFTLKKLDGANSSVTYYLMMSPWDKTHAFSIVNGELISFELSSLINGSINGQRKNALMFKNRITGGTESFYINTRNVDLDARLTNVQEREYISFASPTNEQINSTTTACVYLTELKIMANDTPYYYNKTNRLGYASDWVSNENVSVSLNAGNFITFELSPSLGLTPNTKITYTYKTNYGIEYTEIHLYREKIISREVSSPNDIYAYRAANGTLIYVTKDKFEYHFNRDKYKIFIYDFVNGERSVEQTTNATKSDLSDGETIYTLNQNVDEGGTPYYDNTYVLEIWDRNEVNDDGTAIEEEYHPVKYVYVTLYDKLPRKNKSTTAANEPGQFKLLDASRNNITERITESLSTDEAGYFSEITLMYAEDDTFIPVKYMISTDKVDWEEVASGTIFKNDSDQMQKYYLRIWYDTTYLANEYGSAAYVFGYIDQNQIYEFNLSSLTSTFWIEKTIDGITTILQKNGTIYRAPNGKQYSNHYVVNLSYASRDAVVIKTNREQDIVATNIGADNNGTPIADSDLVFSDIWLVSNAHNTTIPNLPKFTTYVVITYIPTSENFVGEFRTYDENGIISETEELLSMDKKQFIVTQDYSTISRVELQWTKYNGIEYNEINIAITKDGVALKPTIFTRKIEKDGKINSYNYCYLTNSGKYIISLYDNAGNIQKFKYGVAGQTDKFTFIFLKDVPFNVTYTNPNTGEQETSFPIKQAVYNGSVSLEIDKSTQSEFYSNGGYPSLTIYRNGTLLDSDDYVTKEENGKRKFIFSRPGFYEYHFTAKSKELDTTIRQESYQFTIINANEYRYSYIFNKYSNYYIEKVVKNGKDITNRLLKTLNNETITIGQNQYLVELPLSYLDEKTGAGVYLITINSNNKFLQNSNIPSSWTYQVVIQVGTAPISISVAEGQGVTKAVSVTYNASNIYQEMGECTIQVMKHINGQLYAVYRQSIDESSSGVQSTKIDRSEYGSYFVQIVSPSGTLLYSYKVNKKEPMNAASILAIVGSVILFVVIVIIVYRLRKKIAVK